MVQLVQFQNDSYLILFRTKKKKNKKKKKNNWTTFIKNAPESTVREFMRITCSAALIFLKLRDG